MPVPSFSRLSVLFLAALLCAGPTRAADKPNVVVILADDQGWGDLSIHGNTNLSTPHIDSLGRDGALFERFFVCPVCSPTRAEFLTGRYHPRGGVWNVTTGGERLDLDERTIADLFRAAGYTTGAFGKWHNGAQFPYHPRGRGFDDFYGFCSGHWGDYFNPPLEHNGRLVRGEGYITDDLTGHALAFLEANRDRPFFCYLPFNTPHSPMQVPDRFFSRFQNADPALRYGGPEREDVAMTRAALAMCENIDWNVGRLLAKLEELKLSEKTIVLYFSDNGPNSWRWNGGMKGRKGSTDEGGVRAPLLVRWPGHIRPGTRVSRIAAAIDLLPTLADLAAIPVAAGKPLDGTSVAPLLRGDPADWPDRLIFSHWNGQVSVRTQDHRLDASGRLYNMTADPGQTRNLAREQPEVAARLAEAVDRWKRELLPGLRNDKRPFPVGYREFPTTWLPARDGVPHGQVRRSAPAPNCSYFTHWTSTDDRITWDIEAATTGRYEVELYYTCAAGDVGSTLELSCNDSRLQGRVTEAHDPPAHGAEHDRVPRAGESLVKDFKPLRLGVLKLERGRGLLTLKAVEVLGRAVIDLRAIKLTLLGADTEQAGKPNIVFILADDLGYGDVKCLNPQGKIATPHLDRLAANGMIFTDAHSGSSVCTPTRYGVLTGRYCWRSRLASGVQGGHSPPLIEPGRLTVAELLRRQGYHTGAVGKWHLGMDWPLKSGVPKFGDDIEKGPDGWNVDFTRPIINGPTAFGFDEYFGISGSLDMVPYTFIANDRVSVLPTVDKQFPLMLGRKGRDTRRGPAAADFEAMAVLPTLTDRAVQFVNRRAPDAKAGRPFFLYLPLSAPHTPIVPTPEWQGKSGLNPYADFVMQTDATVGAVLGALDANGLAENTLVVFTSDNGCSPEAKFDELLARGHNPSHIFRGTKADIFDGGHRVPFLIRWPGRVHAGSRSAQLVCLTDFMATCAAVLGVALPDTAAEDSVSLLPALLGQAGKPLREAVVHHSINGSFAIRQGNWKLELCPDSGGWSPPRPDSPAAAALPEVQLYDLAADIAEKDNVQAAHPEVVARLTQLLESYVANGRSTAGAPQKNARQIVIRKGKGAVPAAR